MLDFITWDASPVIFSIGPLALRWYGLAFAIGFIIGYNIVAKMFKHEGAPEKWLGILLTYVVVATIIGSRLGHVFFYQWDYYSQHPGEIFKIWEGGLASHGGVIGNFIAVWLFSIFVTKKSVSWTVDRLVVPVAMVAGLIRLGNLMNSEIYGGVTDLPWGFIFVRDGQTLPMHPTQIYEALCYFALFGVLMWMYWKKNAQERPWLISGVFFIGVFVSRFLIEYVKNVQVGKEIEMIATYGINMGQLLSIPFIIMGVVMVVYAMTHPRLKLDYPNKFAEELANNKR
ncbi:MAG: prolipoprotein diacylglyceryl transferase [Muribaculaceae bacterium]|nr:prolipoprotein diacylglyceryl transferase [Muribaculaceae bacterium]MBO7164568.1 prolipoprotein diacylglyceryl transferase [Muribaculaceae bacterium]MBQ2398767.1 prolipoprotein diacylglyceryl transferase [Muribaculaceae bacterium]MBQ5722833.1 prolipoprotein diacylglyceryl transferase [Muribaculaceae bacterium]MEE1366637.1 prolipoprotein diacylglyceryl transferase [Muribaculaceae bacterium]